MRWRGLLAAGLLVLPACGAPASAPAKGPVADLVAASLAAGTGEFDHGAWDRLLAEGTRDGLVDYVYFQEQGAVLDGYLEAVAGADLAALTGDELMALLMNAYNALTVRSILEHPHVKSIRDIDGVWKSRLHRVGGHELTLDGIEHSLLRPFWKDPRVHFGVNCASMSCAPLQPWAFTGAGLEEQLDRVTRQFLSRPDQVRVSGGTLHLSSYFTWYGEDFTAAGWSPRADGIPAFVARYTRDEVRRFIEARNDPPVAFLDYDWSLNAAVAPDPARVSATIQVQPQAAPGFITRLRTWITGLGPGGFVVYVLAYALLTVAFVPAWPLTVGAGAAYGVVLGTVAVSMGSTLGASAAFLLGRTLLRSRVEKWLAGNRKFEAIDRAVGNEGWKIVSLTRLSPAFPFNLLNYAYGLTSIGFAGYLLASWISMLPGTILYVYIGAATADVAQAASGAGGWGRTLLQVVGLLATLLVTVVITRTARRALRQAAGEDVAGDSPEHPDTSGAATGA